MTEKMQAYARQSAQIQVDDEHVKMLILDKQDNKMVWEKTTDKTEDFDIELKNVVANTEYFFIIEVEQIKYALDYNFASKTC